MAVVDDRSSGSVYLYSSADVSRMVYLPIHNNRDCQCIYERMAGRDNKKPSCVLLPFPPFFLKTAHPRNLFQRLSIISLSPTFGILMPRLAPNLGHRSPASARSSRSSLWSKTRKKKHLRMKKLTCGSARTWKGLWGSARWTCTWSRPLANGAEASWRSPASPHLVALPLGFYFCFLAQGRCFVIYLRIFFSYFHHGDFIFLPRDRS